MPPCSNTGAVARSHYGNAAPEGSRERDQSSSAYYQKMTVFNESCRVCERGRASSTFLILSLSLHLLHLSSTSTLHLSQKSCICASPVFHLNTVVYLLRFLSFIRSSPLICHHPSFFYLSSHMCLHQTLTAYITQFQT